MHLTNVLSQFGTCSVARLDACSCSHAVAYVNGKSSSLLSQKWNGYAADKLILKIVDEF